MRNRLIHALSAALAAVVALGAVEPPRPADDAAAASTAMRARAARLRNVRAGADAVTQINPHPKLKRSMNMGNGQGVLVERGTRRGRERFSFLDGLALYESELDEESARESYRQTGVRAVARQVHAFGRNRAESLSAHDGDSNPFGAISHSAHLPASTIDLALGLRMYEANEWLSEVEWGRMQFRQSSGGAVSATLKEASGRTHVWTMGSGADYAVTSYKVYTPSGRVFQEIQCDEFEPVTGVLLPRRVVHREISHADGDGPVTVRETTLTVRDCAVDDPANKPDQYLITWPLGSVVVDNRIGVEFKVASGSRTLTDDAILAATMRNIGNPDSEAAARATLTPGGNALASHQAAGPTLPDRNDQGRPVTREGASQPPVAATGQPRAPRLLAAALAAGLILPTAAIIARLRRKRRQAPLLLHWR